MTELTQKQKISLASFSHPKHRDILVHDEDPDVRCAVAWHGNDKHRDILVHDEDPDVRFAVAKHGNAHHAKALLNDERKQVAREARDRLKQLTK